MRFFSRVHEVKGAAGLAKNSLMWYTVCNITCHASFFVNYDADFNRIEFDTVTKKRTAHEAERYG